MARNRFDIDEKLESEFSFEHLKRSMVYIRHYKRQMLTALFINILSILLSLLSPLVTERVLNVTVPQGDMRELVVLSVFLCVILVGSVCLITWRSRIMLRVGQNIVFEIRRDLFDHLQLLPFSYYDDRPHGKILVRVVQYVNNVSDMLSNGIINFILDLMNIILITLFMFLTDTRLSLVVLAGLPVIAAFLIVIKPRQRRAWQAHSNKNSNLNAYISESINGMKITQLFAREQKNAGIFETQSVYTKKTWMRGIAYSNSVGFCAENTSQAVSSAIYIAGMLMASPAVPFGTLMAMANYANRFWQPINNMANLYTQFINTIAYLERIFETMDEPVSVKDRPDAYVLPPVAGAVSFEHVTFSYDESRVILKDLSFSVRPGERIALVGPTGAGKTTVVNLLSRFYDIQGGVIRIDGHDISKVTLKSLRSQMGIMLQDSFIFSGTIADNIRYGNLDATMEEIEAAARAVHAHEFIMEMEDGYETMLGEGGSRLSGGQKQLLSFARTLAAKPKILVLDEATSSIDTKTELYVQQGIELLLKSCTSFIIAHRLSTIKNCDRIMVIDGQNIAENGSHDELMALGGKYYELYTSQIQADEADLACI